MRAECIYVIFSLKQKRGDQNPEEEEVPENGHNVSAFLDTECRQGEQEPEDKLVHESLQELLFFDFECRQEFPRRQ